MKYKIFTMLLTLGMLSVVPLIYMGKFDPMAFFESGFSMGSSEFSKLKARAPSNLSSAVTDKKIQVYKWRDENGVMQFSNTPPLNANNAEQVSLDPNSNVIQAVKVPVKEEPAQVVQTTTKPANPYSVKGMKKTIDDARNVEKLMQQRHEQQQKALGSF